MEVANEREAWEAANASHCMECGALAEDLLDPVECPHCEIDGGFCAPVKIEPCPHASPLDCNSDDHHFGRGDHVIDIVFG